MPRNSSGVMTYNSGVRGVAGQTLTAAMINGAQDDTANELTLSLPRDGRAPMTGPLPIVSGTASNPGVIISGVAGTGFYWDTVASQLCFAIAGVKVAGFSSSGLVGLPEGDRGDITVSAGGSTWTIDAKAVTLAKIQDITAKRLLGRYNPADGVAELIALGSRLSLSDAGVLDAIIRTPRRHQSVNFGPVDANGLPTFFPASSGSLSLTAQNISADVPLVVSARQGQDFRTATITTAPAWTPGASATNFAYIAIDPATLAATTGVTALAPVYQYGGSPSTTFGQHTYNIAEGAMYLGDGSAANKVWRVFVGEIVTSGSAVTSTIAYAYNGKYRGQVAISSGVTVNHNIGFREAQHQIHVISKNANNGWAENDILPVALDTGATWRVAHGALTGRNTIYIGGAGLSIATQAGGGNNISSSNWDFLIRADRGWD